MASLSRSRPSAAQLGAIRTSRLTVLTKGRDFVDLSAEIAGFVTEIGAREGVVTLFLRHTSASLTIQENADPAVLHDLARALDRLAPEQGPWSHQSEGPDDMPAHVKAMVSGISLQIPVLEGALVLGTWQGVYLIEHRHRPHRREVVVQFIGDAG
ncbi:MAG: secondary thiamine-phosphate synthase enzyme YjbQ [Alphaproteobacteria bacterium]|nr:secondary thiamine-phosphate synthase enzyme YjbQ [Alphaproteobacteria bacterium]